MKIIGKYSFIKRNKNNEIVDKFEKFNTITNLGRKRILELWSESSSTTSFDNLYGLKSLDLSPFNIKPVFNNGSTTNSSGNCELLFDSSNEWSVSSSFFNSGVLKSPFKYNNYTDSYIWFNNYDEAINGYDSESTDKILSSNSRFSTIWKTGSTSSNKLHNWHNIDINKVFCKQKIVVKGIDIAYELWDGHILNNAGNVEKKDIIFKYFPINEESNFLSSGIGRLPDDSNVLKSEKCLSVIVKYYNGTQYVKLDPINDYIFNKDSRTIIFKNNYFVNRTTDVIVEYQVHIITDDIKYGICGLYLDYTYAQNSVNSSKNNFDEQNIFGNGSFSINGGKTWDKYICFPWGGSPVEKYESDNSSNFSGKNTFWINDYADGISKHYFIFYPYVFKNATNFSFYKKLLTDNVIQIKKFNFLVPNFAPQTPQVIALGSGTSVVDINNDNLENPEVYLDVQRWHSTDEDTIASWKSYMDFDIGNGTEFTEIGLFYGDSYIKDSTGGWTNINPIDKNDCTNLFSRTLLGDNSFTKSEDESIEVTYELKIT